MSIKLKIADKLADKLSIKCCLADKLSINGRKMKNYERDLRILQQRC